MDKVSIDDLLLEKESVINSIREIEETCEGIDNKNNSRKLLELNEKKLELVKEKANLNKKLKYLEDKLNEMNGEINKLSNIAKNRILDAINKQRWFFFKNKPKIIMDKKTGLLWPNLNYFNYKKDKDKYYGLQGAREVVKNLNIYNYNNWKIPNEKQIMSIIDDKKFVFRNIINKENYCYCFDDYNNSVKNLDDYSMSKQSYSIGITTYSVNAILIPCYSNLTDYNYEKDIKIDNKIYTEREKQQFTLDIFLKNDLQPIFDDQEITELYRKIYFDKPKLLQRLNSLQEEIDNLQSVELLSSKFDYKVLLSKYDIKAIDMSVIKYYKAIKSIVDDFNNKIDYYQEVKSSIINSFNIISMKLSKRYEDDKNLTDEENTMLRNRKEFLRKSFNLEMNNVRSNLLSIKKQAEEIEERINIINEDDNLIKELAILEKEERASFELITENIANMIKKALLKIEFFESNKGFVTKILDVFNEWDSDYNSFKTSKKSDFIKLCEEESIEEEIYTDWYNDWQKKRLFIEEHLLPIAEYGVKGNLIKNVNDEVSIIEKIIYILKEYKENIDKFYNEERKNIYQKFAFQVGGDLQEKFEVESEIYKITSKFQTNLQDIIFSVDKEEDRVFLIKWASDLFDIQIDEIFDFIKEKELDKISSNILTQFSELKRKNYEIFISDAKLYSEEAANRDKQYNSLIFKMRKELMKK